MIGLTTEYYLFLDGEYLGSVTTLDHWLSPSVMDTVYIPVTRTVENLNQFSLRVFTKFDLVHSNYIRLLL